MENYTITKEQILENYKYALNNQDYLSARNLKEWFPNAFKTELEEWIPVLNYEGFYEVSNFGNVRSLSREVKHSRNPNFIKKVEGRLLVPSLHNKGYYKVRLSKYGKKETKLIHHLVALSFLNHTTSSNICIDHINENKLDNRLDNLQIISKQENTKKSFYFKLDQFKEGDYWFHNTGTLNLIIEVTKTHGGTIKCKSIHSDSKNYSFHGINVMNRKATNEEIETALISEAKKIGYKKGVKCSFGMANEKRRLETNDFKLSTDNELFVKRFNSTTSDIIFKDGKWAEIIPEETKVITMDKAVKILSKKYGKQVEIK